MKICIKTHELFSCENEYIKPYLSKSTYPWEMLGGIKAYALELIEKGIEGYELIAEGVLVGKNASIHPSAVIIAPAIIGEGAEIRPGAYIRGSVIIGKNCVIGNSTELKNAILLDHVQIPHYNYVGDSILGNNTHLGAGSICSNLKSDGKPVVVRADKNYETGLRKFGAILGDGADIGCSCVLNPGTIIGKGTRVYPLNSLRGVYPENCIVKSPEVQTEII